MFIKSELGALVNRARWTTNDTNTASSVSNVEFAEYDNFGPGSGIDHRVQWSKQLTPASVLSYGVDQFLKGYLWLPAMNVSYSGAIQEECEYVELWCGSVSERVPHLWLPAMNVCYSGSN